MKNIFKFASILIFTAGFTFTSNAALLLIFDMNDMDVNNNGTTSVTTDNTQGNPVPTLTLTGDNVDLNGQTGVDFTDDSGTLHNAEEAAAWTSGVNDGGPSFTLNFDSSGFQDLMVRYDSRATSTGPSSAQVEYRVGDSGGFTNFGTDNYTQDSAFHEIALDFSSIDSLEDAGSIHLRWTFSGDGSGSGTFRLDNLQVTATPVPEPKEISLVTGVLLLGCLALRRYTAIFN